MSGEPKINKDTMAHWFVLLAAFLWGTTGTAKSFAPETASPATIGAARLLIGGMTLMILAISSRTLSSLKGLSVISTVLAGAGLALYQPFFFAGVAKTGVAVGTVVTIGSAPVLAGLMGFFARGERPQGRWLVATGFAVLGCIFLFIDDSNVNINVVGVLFSLCAGFGYALFSVASKQLMENRDPVAVTAVVSSVAAVLLLPLLITGDLSWLKEPRGIIVALHLGLITSTVAYILFARGLAVLPVATAVTLSLAEPFTAAMLGILILGEQLTLPVLIGIGLLMTGLGILTLNPGVRNSGVSVDK